MYNYTYKCNSKASVVDREYTRIRINVIVFKALVVEMECTCTRINVI